MKKLILFVLITIILTFRLCTAVFSANPYYIKVNLSTNCTTVYSSADNTPVKAMICSAGNDTPTGTFKTNEQIRWHVLFGNEFGQYCTRITGDILFHSVPYYSKSPNDLNTADYNALGTSDSLGCIRLTAKDAQWIFENCPLNTSVTLFYGSEEDDPLGKPDFLFLGETAPYPTWDPTDPDENNPWQSLAPSISADKSIYIIHSSEKTTSKDINKIINSGITARDTAGNPIAPYVTGNDFPLRNYGIRTVTYTVKDALGKSTSLKIYVIILPCV